jgi:3-dehydro-L-gulonate 2-dehydrogenase
MRISHEQIREHLFKILVAKDFPLDRAEIIAEIFTNSTLAGYHSHGINRFSEFIKNVNKGIIDPRATPTLSQDLGILERYDGNRGAGPSNAHWCMSRAMTLAKEHTIGCVALSNTNHWMRGGSYGWQAADGNCLAICFTNTMANMPPWGGKTVATGNNPLIVAVPKTDGHIVLDMSLSQFSYGKMYEHRLKGTLLPLPGGYDEEGNMTTDPAAIIQTRRILQTGYWKGSGLSLMLDLLATLLSKGKSTAEISKLEGETALSQVFICFDAGKLGADSEIQQTIDDIVSFYQSAEPQQEGVAVRYPGEATLARRNKQLQEGVEINAEIWGTIKSLLDESQ